MHAIQGRDDCSSDYVLEGNNERFYSSLLVLITLILLYLTFKTCFKFK